MGGLSEFLDDLARSMSRPVSRSKALRLAAVAVVSAAAPGAFSSRASAATGCNARGGGCVKTARCCYGPDGYAVSCCPWYVKCRPTSGLCGEQYACEDGRAFCDKSSKLCCGTDEICLRGVCVRPCPPEQQICGKLCCPRGTECVRFSAPGAGARVETCLPKCSRGRARCGPGCCPPNWRCANPDTGLCKRCGSGQEECGRKCCDKRTSYCGDPTHSLCCPKNASSCPTGPVTAPRRTCCKKPNVCARQLPSTPGALTASSPHVCCPPERLVPGSTPMCCAPGQVSLGGKVVAGFGVQGFCCNRSQLCGSGNNVTCCQRFSANIGTDLNQTCCSGKCVTLNYDPANCGACGRACPPGQRCARGVCTA